jgi:hypothetical protein
MHEEPQHRHHVAGVTDVDDTAEHTIDNAIQFHPTGPRPPSRREVLWNELEPLHAQLGIDPPTATCTLKDLEAKVALARHATQQPAAEGRAHFDTSTFNAQPDGGHRRTDKTWRSFYRPLLLNEPPNEKQEQ